MGFAAIRAGYTRAIRSIVPVRLSGERFLLAPVDVTLVDYASDEDNVPALFRRFQIRDGHDDSPTSYSDLHTVRVGHTCTVEIAYPKSFAKYGRDGLTAIDDVIQTDADQVDHAIGLLGARNWQDDQHMSDHQGGLLLDVGPALIRRMLYRIEYEVELAE